MAFRTKIALGYNGSPIAWVGPDEVAWTCGNTLVFQTLGSKAQRILKCSGLGISCFAVSRRHNLLAVADKGLKPNVSIFSIQTFQLIAKLPVVDLSKEEAQGLSGPADKQQPPANVIVLGVTALAFSGDGDRLVVCGDEPDCSLIVYAWRKAEVLGRARLPPFQPASAVAFHPLDPTILATLAGGAASIWYLEPMWDRTVFRAAPMTPGSMPNGHDASAIAWSPRGLYVGTTGGALVLLDITTMAPLVLPGGCEEGAPASPVPLDAASAAGSGAGTDLCASCGVTADGVQLAVVCDTAGPGAGVTALALNRDLVAVGGSDGSLHVWSQEPLAAGLGPPVFSHEVWLRRGGPAGVAIVAVDVGGPEYDTLVLGCPDGTVYRASMSPHAGAGNGARGGYTLATSMVDFPVGRLAGVVPHPGGGAFLTAGADGSVRLWGAEDGQLLARMALSSAQVALAAAAPGAALAAVGSETGVVRILALPAVPHGDASSHPQPASSLIAASTPALNLRVIYRRRLHSSPVDGLAFSPNNDLLLSAGRDGAVWLVSVDVRSGVCRALGFISLPAGERVMGLTWPRAGADVLDGESALLSLAGGGLMSITASAELTSGNWRNPNSDMALIRPPTVAASLNSRAMGSDSGDGGPSAPQEPVTVKMLRLEVPLLAVAAPPHDRSGEIFGLGADKHLHKLALPAEAAAWAGLRARPHRSAVHVLAHARPGGGVTMAPGGTVMVTGAADGVVSMRNLSLVAIADGSGNNNTALHDVTAGGIVGVTFDASGRYIASAGGDGAIFLFEVLPGSTAANALVTPPWAQAPHVSTSSARSDADAIDDLSELTEVELLRRHAAYDGGGVNGESRRAAVASRLDELRARIADVLAANDMAPELEKLGRSELIVDLGLVERLKRDTEARAAAVAAAVRSDNLRTALLADRLRRMVWDSMMVKGAVVSGLRSATAVHNFPLAQPGSSERVLRQVTMLRRVEMLEHQALGVVPYQFLFRGNNTEPAAEGDEGASEGANSAPDAHAAAAAAAAAATAAAVANANNSNGIVPPDALMYSEFDLHCNTRKALQIHLIKQKIRELKAAFNTDFSRVGAQKRADCDRIADLNARMDETIKDLRKMGAVPPLGLLEERFTLGSNDTRDNIPATVLTVRDEEVGVERYVSPEESARLDAARRAEEEAAARSARDNAGERALRQMMGGSLAARGSGGDGEGNPFSLPPPAWLTAMGLNPDAVNLKSLSDEQARELKDWQSREKALQEDRSRRVSVLELELRTAKGAVEDVVGRFEEVLAGLALRRHKVAAEIAALEARVLALATALGACARASEAVEKGLLARLGGAKEAHGRAAGELTERRATLTELESRQAAAAAEERMLDRNFRKEFAEADLSFNRLLQLYRMRRPEHMLSGAGGSAALTSMNAGGQGESGGPGSVRNAGGPVTNRQSSAPGASSEAGGGGGSFASAATIAAHAMYGSVPMPQPSSSSAVNLINTAPPTYAHPPPLVPPMITSISLEPFPEIPPGVVLQLQPLGANPTNGMALGAGPHSDMPRPFSSPSSYYPQLAAVFTNPGQPQHHTPSGGSLIASVTVSAAGNIGAGPHGSHIASMQRATSLQHGAGAHGSTAHGGGGAHAATHSAAVAAAVAAAALDPTLKPDAVEPTLWERFVSYRAERVAAEAAVRGAAVDLVVARRDLPELEAREAALLTEMEGLMSAITTLRTERRTTAYDNVLQLRLLAGQVEAVPPAPASADMSDAQLLGRGVVVALNAVVLGKGTKKVEILTAMKNFKRGIYAAQWEAAAADMRLEDLRAKIRDLQLLHVTRDMQAVLKDGEDRSTALEAASLEALSRQRERLHAKALDDKRRRLAKLAADVAARSAQNQEVAVHLVTLGKVLEEQQRLQAGMQSSSEQAARRMRSLVTHKKLKEIALAQQTELAELRAQVEKMRLRTYPTFVEMGAVAGMPTIPQRLPPDLKMLTQSASETAVGASEGAMGGVPTGPPLRS